MRKESRYPLASRRSVIKLLGAGAGAIAAAPFVRNARAADPLFVNTWGGDWEKAAVTQLFAPFTRDTGIPIRTVSPVSYAKLEAQARTGVYEFDVTTLGGGELIRALKADLVEPIDTSIIDVKQLAPGQVYKNGIASHAFATVIASRKDKFPHGGPQNWAQFWDTQHFPGARSMQRYAARVIPFALLADGVDPKTLYPLDLDRGFKSLQRVKKDVRVWWMQGEQSQQLLVDGEVNSIAIWHGRALSMIRQNIPLDLVWNQGEIDRAYWVVSKGTPRAKQAWQFIASALKADRLAGFCIQADYSPVDQRVFQYIPDEKAKLMPTYPANYRLMFEQDLDKLAPQVDELSRRFNEFVMR